MKKSLDGYSVYNGIGFAAGLALFVLFEAGVMGRSLDPAARRVAGVAILMAIWWITQCIPIPATSLLPVVLFPFLGIMKTGDVTLFYAKHNIFLFIGGFIIAIGIQKWNLHKRIALTIVSVIGSSPRRIVLGFIVATAFLSMWISNTATTMMMFPIGLAVIAESERLRPDEKGGGFPAALMLGIAYAASIGGIATPIGTPPNIEFLGQFRSAFPDAPPISFFDWMKTFLPLVLVFLPVMWAVLVFGTSRVRPGRSIPSDVIRGELKSLGPMTRAEIMVLAVFVVTGALWMFRKDINLEILAIPGWSNLLPQAARAYVNDATVAMAMAIVMFMIPVNARERKFLMDWESAVKLPWGIVLLFGGGFALAGGFTASGLDTAIGEMLEPHLHAAPVFIVSTICVVITFLTEVTSNTATTAAFLPIMRGASVAIGSHPLLFMLPATLAASCAFMLPVATPPNAIIFGSGKVSMGRMALSGIFLNLIGVLIITAVIFLLATPAFNIDLSAIPTWALK